MVWAIRGEFAGRQVSKPGGDGVALGAQLLNIVLGSELRGCRQVKAEQANPLAKEVVEAPGSPSATGSGRYSTKFILVGSLPRSNP